MQKPFPHDQADQIERWAALNKIVLGSEDRLPNRRFFYISKEGDTFQVVIEPESEGEFRIDLHLIETSGDRSAHIVWMSSGRSFAFCLDSVLKIIEIWHQS